MKKWIVKIMCKLGLWRFAFYTSPSRTWDHYYRTGKWEIVQANRLDPNKTRIKKEAPDK